MGDADCASVLLRTSTGVSSFYSFQVGPAP